MSIAVKSNPKLWKQIKEKFIKGNKGGLPGTNSARKMQMAVQEYKKRGGGYIGKLSAKNSMKKWTKEEWGYISPNKKSQRGRYLPRKVRMSLTSSEKKRENRKKGSKKGMRIKYSESVKRKMRKLNIF